MLKNFLLLILVLSFCLLGGSCSTVNRTFGFVDESDKPKEIELPGNPIERAAVQGLKASYDISNMWQMQNVVVLNITPVAPNSLILQNHDPKELYCVCLEYEARYKVPWSTAPGAPWEQLVRNILVMKTQSDTYLAMKPMNICPPFCS